MEKQATGTFIRSEQEWLCQRRAKQTSENRKPPEEGGPPHDDYRVEPPWRQRSRVCAPEQQSRETWNAGGAGRETGKRTIVLGDFNTPSART